MKLRLSPKQLLKKQNTTWLTDPANSQPLPHHPHIIAGRLMQLQNDLEGRVVFPWSPSYTEDKREFNDVYPANPDMIVFVASYQDIQVCLKFAQDAVIPTSIRSGRHSLAIILCVMGW